MMIMRIPAVPRSSVTTATTGSTSSPDGCPCVWAATTSILTAREVAEFDTRTPTGGQSRPEPTEILALFGPQGERMHVRIRPRPAAET
jgi:hypothetical protein